MLTLVNTAVLSERDVEAAEALSNCSITLMPEDFSLANVKISASSKEGPLSTTILIDGSIRSAKVSLL